MDPRRRARIILIVGVLLALGTAAGTFFYASSAQQASAPPPPPTTAVVVAARELPARTELAATDVKVVQVNVDAAPAAALTDPKLAIGRVLATAVTVNEPLFPAKFLPEGRAFTVFPPGESVQPGSPAYRVMTINVPDGSAVGGVLEKGDVVDIMYVFSFDPASKLDVPTPGPAATTSPFLADTVAKIVLGPVQLLARQGSVYTIRVDAVLAEQIAYVQAGGGQLQFLLRAPTDDRAVDTSGATFVDVYERFKFPIPERVSPTP